MREESKLLEMLTGYAAAHQHPFNVAIHLVGIPVIMLGVFIPLTWIEIGIKGFTFNLAHLATAILFIFYLTLDVVFSLAFLVYAIPVAMIATRLGETPFATSATVAGVLFVGGYLAQFIGHAVEKSAPVILKHPVQANLAAPFFIVVEIFKIMGLRDKLFDQVQARISEMKNEQAA